MFKTAKVKLLTKSVRFPVYKQYNIEPRREISNTVVCATSKAPDQHAHTRCLIRAFASLFNIL